jgi:hypothetical protein
MERLYAKMPDGTWHGFGAKNAEIAAALPPVECDIFVASLVTTEAIGQVGAGNVGEFPLCYEIRSEEPSAVLTSG